MSECWLVNKRFLESYPGALGTSEALEVVKTKSVRNNRNLNDNLGRAVAENDVFVLVASKTEEVRSKVDQLVEIVQEQRKALGKD